MARKKSKDVNKSQAVRDYLSENPDATASKIIPELAKRGINVSPALVSQIKQRLKKSGNPTAPEKRAGAKKTMRNESRSGSDLTADKLVEAKKLVEELGGLDQARGALSFLEELS